MQSKSAHKSTIELQKKYLAQSMIYKVASIILSIIGLMTFVQVYVVYSNGDPAAFIRRPMLIIIMLLPFLPAYILMLIADKKKRKIRELSAQKR
ncbi:MAG: hypothetical protein KTR28_08625 [Micavibrio sp.]|nr:hypothetical protein [Micavibrio sp.]